MRRVSRRHPALRRTCSLALAFLALASCAKAPCDEPFSCPLPVREGEPAVLSCVPPQDGDSHCLGACHAWIAENCADVVFIY
jgi:hypothetical protein